MNIAIIGPGRIGGNLAKRFALAGHTVALAFSRDMQKLEDMATQLGTNVHAMTPREAVMQSDVVVLSVPWSVVDLAIEEMGDLQGKIIIDTTNHFGNAGVMELETSSLSHNQSRLPGAAVIKSFNTLTSSYQEGVGEHKHGDVAMFFSTEDEKAKHVAMQLIPDTGFTPVFLGGFDVVSLMEAPRRKGAVYGEAYRPSDAEKIAAVAASDPEAAARFAVDLRIQD